MLGKYDYMNKKTPLTFSVILYHMKGSSCMMIKSLYALLQCSYSMLESSATYSQLQPVIGKKNGISYGG